MTRWDTLYLLAVAQTLEPKVDIDDEVSVNSSFLNLRITIDDTTLPEPPRPSVTAHKNEQRKKQSTKRDLFSPSNMLQSTITDLVDGVRAQHI